MFVFHYCEQSNLAIIRVTLFHFKLCCAINLIGCYSLMCHQKNIPECYLIIVRNLIKIFQINSTMKWFDCFFAQDAFKRNIQYIWLSRTMDRIIVVFLGEGAPHWRPFINQCWLQKMTGVIKIRERERERERETHTYTEIGSINSNFSSYIDQQTL